jgi:hypothetical protein
MLIVAVSLPGVDEKGAPVQEMSFAVVKDSGREITGVRMEFGA